MFPFSLFPRERQHCPIHNTRIQHKHAYTSTHMHNTCTQHMHAIHAHSTHNPRTQHTYTTHNTRTTHACTTHAHTHRWVILQVFWKGRLTDCHRTSVGQFLQLFRAVWSPAFWQIIQSLTVTAAESLTTNVEKLLKNWNTNELASTIQYICVCIY